MTTNWNNVSSLFRENLPTNCGNSIFTSSSKWSWMHLTRTFERRLELRALLSNWLSCFHVSLSASRRGCGRLVKFAGNYLMRLTSNLWIFSFENIHVYFTLRKFHYTEREQYAICKGRVQPVYRYFILKYPYPAGTGSINLHTCFAMKHVR